MRFEATDNPYTQNATRDYMLSTMSEEEALRFLDDLRVVHGRLDHPMPIGTAGVPAGSIPVVVMILGLVGIPAEGIGVVLGVDRFLDMCRTTLNVVGDITAATFVARSEGYVLATDAPPPAKAAD